VATGDYEFRFSKIVLRRSLF